LLLVLRPARDGAAAKVLAAELAAPIAAMSVVLAAGQSTNSAVVLAAAACAYDLATFVMGNNRTALGGPVGVAFGWISIAVVGLFATAAMDPPFDGPRTVLMIVLVGLLAPGGIRLGTWLAGPVRSPALRRLDSLLLSAPAWVIAVAFVIHQ
jgi:hypothetical protein